jgi:uncharacterized protein YtpQ (UPF0354 family)
VGGDWKLYAKTDQYIRYYNANGITRPSKNIVRVWVRWDYTDKGIIDIVKNLGKKYENIHHTIMLDEINCSDKKVRTLSFSDYSRGGKAIRSGSFSGEWNYFFPESVTEALYEVVCK